MKVTVLGAGAYGLALASILDENNCDTYIWTKFEEEKQELTAKGVSSKLPGFTISKNIKVETNIEKCIKDSKLIVIAIPTAFVSDTVEEFKNLLEPNQHICIASKGIEQGSLMFAHDIVTKITNTSNVGVISGPSFAIDVVNKCPIGLSLGYTNIETINIIKKAFENSHFKLRETNDIIGVEICGAIKNVAAIAAGIIDGLNMPESTKAFLITETLNDIKDLISSLNGNNRTILSFAGFGDILLTCTSEKSRNYTFGKLLGEGLDKEETKNYLDKHTVEGVYTLKSIYNLVKDKDIEFSFINLIYNIIFRNTDPNKLLEFLVKKN